MVNKHNSKQPFQISNWNGANDCQTMIDIFFYRDAVLSNEFSNWENWKLAFSLTPDLEKVCLQQLCAQVECGNLKKGTVKCCLI